MKAFRRILGVLLLLIAFVTVHAQAAEGDVAAAELLFQKGRAAMDAGDYEAACANFAESQRLDPAAGTVMNLATCQEQRGRLASAWENWEHALRLLDKNDRRRPFVEKRVSALEADLPRLTITVAPGTAKTISIFRDGTELGKVTWGESLPVDAGEHEVVVQSVNHAARTYKIVVLAGESKTLEVTTGARLPDPAPEDAEDTSGKTLRALAYVSTGVGIVGVATAVATGLMLPDTKETVQQNCPGKVCNETGLSAVSRGKTLLALNTAGWIVGGVGLAAGTTLFITSFSGKGSKKVPEKTARASVRFLGDGATVTYSGDF